MHYTIHGRLSHGRRLPAHCAVTRDGYWRTEQCEGKFGVICETPALTKGGLNLPDVITPKAPERFCPGKNNGSFKKECIVI